MDKDAGIAAFSEAAGIESAVPMTRLEAARAAAEMVGLTDPVRAARLLEAAVRLLPNVAPRRLILADQQFALGAANGLAADAAALALQSSLEGTTDEEAVVALGLLETGRTVILSQIVDGRSECRAVAAVRPLLDPGQQALPDQLAAALGATCRAWDGGQRGGVASGDVVARLQEALGIARNLGFF
jgi:hypothetical protein